MLTNLMIIQGQITVKSSRSIFRHFRPRLQQLITIPDQSLRYIRDDTRDSRLFLRERSSCEESQTRRFSDNVFVGTFRRRTRRVGHSRRR